MTAATSTALTAGDRSFPWRGELPTSWSTKPLKYLTRMNANTWGENTDPELLLRYVDIGSVNSNGEIGSTEDLLFENAPSRARRIVSDGDVLISTVRTYLRAIAFCERASENLTCSTGFAVVTAGTAVDPKFLFYWARSSHFVDEIVSRSLGVSYPAINAAEIGNLPFPTIGRDEQQQIAAFLDHKTAELDAVLHLKKRQLGLLAEKRQALISQAVTRGLDPTAPLKPSGIPWLGDVPRHWEVKRLKFVKSGPLMYGANEAATSDDPDMPRFIRITDLNDDGTLREDTFRSLPEDVAAPYILNDGDFLFARSGATVGKAFMYSESLGRACFAGYLIRLRPLRRVLIHDFLRYYIQSAGYEGAVKEVSIQSTIQNVSAEKYSNFTLPLPPPPEQQAIVNDLDRETAQMDRIAQTVRTQIEKVREYRQALISEAVTGKIDVRGQEKASSSACQD